MDWKSLATRLIEAPIEDISFHGPLDKTHGLDNIDRRLVNHEVNKAKLVKAFQLYETPIYVYFVNLPGRRQYAERGSVDLDFIKTKISDEVARLIASRSPDAAHIVYTNNTGDARFPMTPWIVVHRLGHALRAGYASPTAKIYEQYVKEVNEFSGIILKYGYGYEDGDRMRDLAYQSGSDGELKRALFLNLWRNIGNFKSAKVSLDRSVKPRLKLNRIGEVPHELLAQYLISGQITTRDLPPVLTATMGRHNKRNFRLTTDAPELSEAENAKDHFEWIVSHYADKLINTMGGKIFVM